MHGEPAEHGLGDHAGDEAEREPDQVAPPGITQERSEHAHDHRDRHRAGEHPVHELDHRVAVGRARAGRATRAGSSANRGSRAPIR